MLAVVIAFVLLIVLWAVFCLVVLLNEEYFK